jgi:hypothetical protein
VPPEVLEVPETKITGNESALAFGVGAFIRLNDHFFVDTLIKYQAITNARANIDYEDDQTLNGISRTIQYVSLLAGINYRF